MLKNQSTDVNIHWDGLVGQGLAAMLRLGECKLLWRRRGTERRAVGRGNLGTLVTKGSRDIVGSSRDRLVGRVRAAAVFKTGNLLVNVLRSVGVVASAARSIWQHRVARDIAISGLGKVWHGSRKAVGTVGQLTGSQGLGRIHARGWTTEDLAILGHVELGIASSDCKVISARVDRSRDRVTRRKSQTSELIHDSVHGQTIVGSASGLALREGSALALGLLLNARVRVIIRVGGGARRVRALGVGSSLLERHGDLGV